MTSWGERESAKASVGIGRPSALERTPHFFMELAERMNLIGEATETEFNDTLGLTAIHINRVLRQLRERRLLTMRKGTVIIHDLAALRKLAGFQGGYPNSALGRHDPRP